MKGEKALAWVAFAIVCVVWGTTYLAIRIAMNRNRSSELGPIGGAELHRIGERAFRRRTAAML